jgi:hypothetical protein
MRRSSTLLSLAALAALTFSAHAGNPAPIHLSVDLCRTNAAGTSYSPLRMARPFDVEVVLLDAAVDGTVLHTERLHVVPRSVGTPNLPETGEIHLVDRVTGPIELVLGATAAAPLPPGLLGKQVWFTTRVTLTKGKKEKSYGATPPRLVPPQVLAADLLRHLRVVELPVDDLGATATAIRFEGVNVQIVNGLGATNGDLLEPTAYDSTLATVNGVGNLIVGYNEPFGGTYGERTGSHVLVVGVGNQYRSFGGLVAGSDNILQGPFSAITGGSDNHAEGALSAVCGGVGNHTSKEFSTVAGGYDNEASGFYATVGGGIRNLASGQGAAVGGGDDNHASGATSSISGGLGNEANGHHASVSGGADNTAGALCASVAAGLQNLADGQYASVAGGHLGRAAGSYSSVTAGQGNIAGGAASSVTGGWDNSAAGSRASVSGGMNNHASGLASSVSGGGNFAAKWGNEATGTGAWVGGGNNNVASGDYAVVNGGQFNSAQGEYSSVNGGHAHSALWIHDAMLAGFWLDW